MSESQSNRHSRATALPSAASDPNNPLSQEYAAQQALFERQPQGVQRYLEAQARVLAEALIQRPSQVRFGLPDRVVLDPSGQITPLPAQSLEQMAGGLLTGLTGADIRSALRHQLSELEEASDPAVAAAAGLLRYATATHMVYHMLPSGRTVTYRTVEGEEIPTLPVMGEEEAASAITEATDAIAEEGEPAREGEARGELLVPYVPAARRFYLPQWVAFDDEGKLLVKSTQEAERLVASMQNFLGVLHAAVALAPYMVADLEYQRKRYGILGQLIHQGRALAMHQTREIIDTIKRRAAANDLNRGLSLSLPYFDDQALEMKMHDFVIIPAGRIMFVPSFVVRAAREERAKVAQDTRLNASTRKYLLKEIDLLGTAFLPDSGLEH